MRCESVVSEYGDFIAKLKMDLRIYHVIYAYVRTLASCRSAEMLTSASVPRPSWRLRRMFFTVPFCSPESADAPSVLLRSVSSLVEHFFKIRIQQAMTDEVASFSGGAAELNVHRLPGPPGVCSVGETHTPGGCWLGRDPYLWGFACRQRLKHLGVCLAETMTSRCLFG